MKKQLLFFVIPAVVGWMMVDTLSTYPGFKQVASTASAL